MSSLTVTISWYYTAGASSYIGQYNLTNNVGQSCNTYSGSRTHTYTNIVCNSINGLTNAYSNSNNHNLVITAKLSGTYTTNKNVTETKTEEVGDGKIIQKVMLNGVNIGENLKKTL